MCVCVCNIYLKQAKNERKKNGRCNILHMFPEHISSQMYYKNIANISPSYTHGDIYKKNNTVHFRITSHNGTKRLDKKYIYILFPDRLPLEQDFSFIFLCCKLSFLRKLYFFYV